MPKQISDAKKTDFQIGGCADDIVTILRDGGVTWAPMTRPNVLFSSGQRFPWARISFESFALTGCCNSEL